MLQSLAPIRRCKSPVSTVAISRNGTRYLWAGGSPGEDCSISVCDVASNKVLHTLDGHKDPVMRARFLEDDSVVSFSFDSHICLWTSTGALAALNETHLTRRADGFAVSSDGKLAVTGDYGGQISGWRLYDGSRSFTFKESSRGLHIQALALEPNGKHLLSGGSEGKIRKWVVGKKRQQLEVDLGWGHHVQALAWHPGGATFVAAIAPDGAAPEESRDRVVIFDASSGKELASLFADGQPLCCAFNLDGRLIAAAGGGDRGGRETKANCVIHVWSAVSGLALARFAGHTGLVRDLAFTPDSRWLLSAGWDRTVRSWRLDSRA
jgi:WD40 repeat protein